jgi:hypothetical protein
MSFRLSRAVSLAALLAGLIALPAASRAQEIKLDSETFSGLDLRPIGPAAMSGRIAAIDGVEGDRLLLYVGAAGGGLWKSVDGGVTFKPVFDKYCQSIGAIAIDRRDTRKVWVGTGESWMRNSVSVGDGVYRTPDGGETWQKMGLDSTEHIARIVVDPRGSDTVYVAATGTRVGRQSAARRLSHARWRQDLAAGAVRQQRHRLRRHRDRSGAARHPLRRDVAVPAQALVVQLRWPGQRCLQEHRWRQHLEARERRAAERRAGPLRDLRLARARVARVRVHRSQA